MFKEMAKVMLQSCKEEDETKKKKEEKKLLEANIKS